MNDELELDARTAAAVAAGMLSVALADGEIHPRELELIRQFEDEIPDDVDPSGVTITDERVREVLARSLLMTALADGRISDEERAVIVEICRAHGLGDERLAAIEHTVRRELLALFDGVVTHKDQVARIAAELGLGPTST